MTAYILEAILGYLLGSISFSVVLTTNKFKKDVREEGSGNAGATNVARVFGLKMGLITLLLDVLKLLIPMYIAMYFSKDIGVAVAGVAGVLGHCFPLYFNFRGGKGVSVAITVALFLDWRVVVISLAVFIIFVLLTKIVSLSSCIAAVTLSVTTLIFLPTNVPKIVLGVFTTVIILFMHRANIKRLIKGEEKKFTPSFHKGEK